MIDINLVPPPLRKKHKSQMFPMATLNLPKEAIVGLVGGLFAVLLVVHFLLQIIIFVKFAQHASARRHLERIQPEKKKVDLVIDEMRNLQGKINSIDKVTNLKRILWSQKLNDVSDCISRGVWLNKVSLDQKILLVDGSAVSKMKDEMVSVGNFTANLKGNKSFMAGLDSIELGSIQRRQVKAIDLVDFVVTVKLQ